MSEDQDIKEQQENFALDSLEAEEYLEQEQFDEVEALEASEEEEALLAASTQEDAFVELHGAVAELDSEEEEADDLDQHQEVDLENTELAEYESGEVEQLEFLDTEEISSVVESVLFANNKPISFKTIKECFKGTQVKTSQIKKAIEQLKMDYANPFRGFTLEEVTNGYQLRTKMDNLKFLKGQVKKKSFKLSGPALEVLSIVAYKQPCIKHDVDEIRGVESGHLVRGLLERGLLAFAGKSELPGKPMYYATTKKFLEIFGLRNLTELPSLSEIDDLIPDGIGDEMDKKETLGEVAENLDQGEAISYSSGEEELEDINAALSDISVTTDFFEQEKVRIREERDRMRAEDIQQALDLEEEVDEKDIKWLERFNKAEEEKLALQKAKDEKEGVEENQELEEDSTKESDAEVLLVDDSSAEVVDEMNLKSEIIVEESSSPQKTEKQIQADLDVWMED
ncbi:MAG: SMC-Scp complex subunit ScpB [Bdellovibrionales bacterium]|nr:SMC-Scp complex subunit ScpB [Bdellovibrionales bacterium]